MNVRCTLKNDEGFGPCAVQWADSCAKLSVDEELARAKVGVDHGRLHAVYVSRQRQPDDQANRKPRVLKSGLECASIW